ncbi:Membrane-bound lytic murein transglycosylase MltF [Desulfonatronum thiosulfatophilum]|uniref:Membrane-bound lytic murein transglycosylase MltF n=1 Tax=Desulfonatronum thiosulfatophilum TaxID=617002 RepID=A0A1G6E748_9BACT|nr:transglycosylase SLT domain-containing protein [Desulfonatronum thiosulfatophilum]SDB53259.1 Membrane-bound lytic murein transglycosylase MltF [Desulfonatronum thiosulfatophilum]
MLHPLFWRGIRRHAAFGMIVFLAVMFSDPAGAQDPALPASDSELPVIWTGDLEGMRERRLIRVGTAFSRTHYFWDGFVQRGLAYDALLQFEQFLNKELKTPKALQVRLLIVPLPRNELLPALTRGHLDLVVANLTITPERSETMIFSDPVARNVNEIVVLGPAAPSLDTLDDLSGTTAHLRPSSSYWASVESFNHELKELGKKPVRLRAVDEHLEDEDLLEMVAAGILPYAIVDTHKAAFWADVIDGLTVREDLTFRAGAELGWAMRTESPELAALVNAFVPQIRAGSAAGNMLLRRYLRQNPWVRNPSATEDQRRFEHTSHLFQKYGERYGFDWLMLAAQGYQESRIDQSARSPAGALGIMQLLPTTAADPVVGIPDISNAKNNIHAGARYLRHLKDRYLNDPEIDDLNRTLLAFAGYNAGPGNLVKIRGRATAMGLDPNRWFGNVELAAAKVIGRETVVYVGNIAKYHYAYRLITEAAEEYEESRRLFDP